MFLVFAHNASDLTTISLTGIFPIVFVCSMGYTVLEIVPKPQVDIVALKGIFNAAFKTATYLPSMNSRFSVLLPHDDIDSMNKVWSIVLTQWAELSKISQLQSFSKFDKDHFCS